MKVSANSVCIGRQGSVCKVLITLAPIQKSTLQHVSCSIGTQQAWAHNPQHCNGSQIKVSYQLGHGQLSLLIGAGWHSSPKLLSVTEARRVPSWPTGRKLLKCSSVQLHSLAPSACPGNTPISGKARRETSGNGIFNHTGISLHLENPHLPQ